MIIQSGSINQSTNQSINQSINQLISCPFFFLFSTTLNDDSLSPNYSYFSSLCDSLIYVLFLSLSAVRYTSVLPLSCLLSLCFHLSPSFQNFLFFFMIYVRASEQVSCLRAEVAAFSKQLEPLADEEVILLNELSKCKSQLRMLKDELREAEVRVKQAEKNSQLIGREDKGSQDCERNMSGGSESKSDIGDEGNERILILEGKVRQMRERCQMGSLNRTTQQESTVAAREVLFWIYTTYFFFSSFLSFKSKFEDFSYLKFSPLNHVNYITICSDFNQFLFLFLFLFFWLFFRKSIIGSNRKWLSYMIGKELLPITFEVL